MSCHAWYGLFAGIKISIRNCQYAPIKFIPSLPANPSILSANFLERNFRSKSTLTIPLTGSFSDYTFPAKSKAVFHINYRIPLTNRSAPFESTTTTCTLTVPSYNSTKALCDCNFRPEDGGVCVDCTKVKLIDATPGSPDVYYPVTYPC